MPENAQVVITPATLPEGSCFTTEQQRLNAFAEHLTGALPGEYSTVNVGPNAPEADDRTKPWLRSNSDGTPDGLYYYYNGSWKRPHPLSPGMIMQWAGSPADVPNLDGGAAGVVTVNQGPFWEIATEFAAKFPVGVGTFASGAAVAVTGTGGEEKHTLTTAELPEVLGSFGEDVLKVYGRQQGEVGAAVGGTGQMVALDFEDVVKGGTTATDKSHNNLPPFYGVYFIKRTARIYYSI